MAKAKAAKKDQGSEITILQLNQGELTACIVGTDLTYNAIPEKARHELFMPSPKKTRAARAVTLKHEPFSEYRNSTYQNRGDDAATRLCFPSVAFKKSMAGAALDIPGDTSKAQIGRLVWTVGQTVDIFGVPKLWSTIVRMKDVARTPDVRTRAILPEWAAIVRVRFMEPILRQGAIATLLAAAGCIQGIGDGRQEKGSLSNGQFRLVDADDEDFQRICATGGIVEQDDALKNPTFYDEPTERLITWYLDERARRDGDQPQVLKAI